MTKILHRNDTSTNWATVNPVLEAGEIGIETDTLKFKIGNGSTAWNSLAYQGSHTAGNGIDITDNEISILAGEGLSFSNIAQLPNTYSSSSGDITASSQEVGQYAYQAFDGNNNTFWGLTAPPSSSSHAWIQRHHNAIKVTSVRILFTSERIMDIYIKGSNDGINFTQIGQFTNNVGTDITITCNPSQTYTYTRIEYGQPYSGWGQTIEIQINYETNHSVLVNTNPTAPTIDQTYNASSTNAQSGVAVASALSSALSGKVTGTGINNIVAISQADYDNIGTYYAYVYDNTTVYIRTNAPTTETTVYSAIDTTSALTISSVDTGTLTLSDGNTYTYTSTSNLKDETQYDSTILYVIRNIIA